MSVRGLFFLLLLIATGCSGPAPEADSGIAVERALGGSDDAGFERALTPRRFHFPRDHGPHPGFRNEWWYFTGNLADPQGRRFGFQVTFFRIALSPGQPSRPSHWATHQVWMAHVALTDVAAERHLARERLERGALGLAGARAEPLRVWTGDWAFTGAGNAPWRLRAETDAFGLELELTPLAAPVLQGDAGLSRKSATPGNASYYYSIPRLATNGRVRVADQVHAVQGLSWLDREWSTSALAADQAGWDWFSMQLDDGTDLMYYRLRRKDGSADPHSRGSAWLADRRRVELTPDRVRLAPLAWWRSAEGTRYPVAWDMALPQLDRTLRVRALVKDQRMDLSVKYWEGAVEIQEPADGSHLGYGYLELAGYERSQQR